jgi:hypothetical protein
MGWHQKHIIEGECFLNNRTHEYFLWQNGIIRKLWPDSKSLAN